MEVTSTGVVTPEPKPLMSGGPGDPLVTKKSEVTDAPPAEKKPIYEGFAGAIEGTEEWTKYTKGLEEEVIKLRMSNKSTNAPAPIAPAAQPKTKIDEIWYSDPEKAAALVEERVLAKVEGQKAAERNQIVFWEKFYGECPDLRQHKELVDLVVSKKIAEWRNLPEAEGKKLLAKETRDILSNMKKSFGVTEKELNSGGATMLGASGESAPKAESAPAKPLSFADQVAKMKRKKVS